jgi:hypothetical protein
MRRPTDCLFCTTINTTHSARQLTQPRPRQACAHRSRRASCRSRWVVDQLHVSNARLVLIILLCASPAVLLLDVPMTPGLVAGAAAAGLTIVAASMRPAEMAFFLSIARPVAPLLAVPALWMLIQVLPLNFVAHPNWQSAEAALGRPIGGAISVDIGAGVIALGRYLTIVAVGFWSCAVAVDRLRAEWILFALVAATASISLLVIVMGFFGTTPIGAGTFAQAVDCVTIGLIIAGAGALRTMERYETRHSSPHRSVRFLVMTFAGCVAAFVASVAALLVAAPAGVLVAAGYGVAVFAAAVAIRRLGVGRWGVAGIAIPAVVLAVVLAGANSNLRAPGLSLAFAAGASPSSLSMSERILADAPWQGTGAGTFAAIAPIYRGVDDAIVPSSAPTAVATIAIELGGPLCWLIIAAMAGAIVILFRSALRRGRDSFYAAAGTACLVALLFLFFVNAGVLGTAPAVIAAAMLGLALAQSKSRSAW